MASPHWNTEGGRFEIEANFDDQAVEPDN